MAECPNVFQAVAARPPASHAAGLRSLWGTNHEPGHGRRFLMLFVGCQSLKDPLNVPPLYPNICVYGINNLKLRGNKNHLGACVVSLFQ